MGAPLTIPRRLLTLDEYHTIGAAGVLKEDDRIELIEGELIEMAPIGSRHMAKVNWLVRLLSLCVGDQAILSVQNPIALPPHNEPQPDFTLLKPRADYYEGKLPGAEDILLVIEVSDTTLVGSVALTFFGSSGPLHIGHWSFLSTAYCGQSLRF